MTESVFIRNRSGSLPGLGTDAAGGYENTSRRIDENVQKQEEISAITQHCGFSEARYSEADVRKMAALCCIVIEKSSLILKISQEIV